MDSLQIGANRPLAKAITQWTLSCDTGDGFQQYAGIALLPVDDKRVSNGSAALLHQEKPWMAWRLGQGPVGCTLNLAKLPDGASRVLVVVYVYSVTGPVSRLGNLRLSVDEAFETHVDVSGYGDSAVVVGEFYHRGSDWKFRALAEGSAYGLAAFGRRIGLDVDDSHPDKKPEVGAQGVSATGTGFAVAGCHVLTCAHVIEGMADVQVSSLGGCFPAEIVMVDRRNDLALLRLPNAPALAPIAFQHPPRCGLGENVVALGFPLSGLAGDGIHVTQGGVSSLFGLRNDASLLQFTAPIQPGSSGSPLLDSMGAVVGMVTSTITDAQNMNFAVKAELVVAFLDACGVDVVYTTGNQAGGSTAEMARNAQPSIWLVKAQA